MAKSLDVRYADLLFALLHSIKATNVHQKSSQIYQSIKTKKSQQTTGLIGLIAGVVIIRWLELMT